MSKAKPVINHSDDHYVGMPDYDNEKKPEPLITATFKFRTVEDYNKFHALVKEHIYNGTKVFDGMQRKEKKQSWYPLPPRPSHYNYIGDDYEK